MQGQLHIRRRLGSRSLRRTLVMYLMIACLLPLALVGIITYTSIYSILTNKIQSGISASLKQEAAALENLISNLDFASKQFALDGQMVDEVSAFLSETQIYKKSEIMTRINEKMNLVNFTNPYLGLTAYVMPAAEGDPVLFSNLSVNPNFAIDKLRPFVKYNGATYSGPHRTMYNYSENIVFSSVRPVRVSENHKVYVYLESNYNLFRKILNPESYGVEVSHLLINEHGEIAYVENDEAPIPLSQPSWQDASLLHEEFGGYHLFRYKSEQGWELITAVKKSTFNSELRLWYSKMVLLTFAMLLFAGLIAMLIWRKVYRPLRKVNIEIVRMAENRTAPVTLTRIEEFDLLLMNFQEMKSKVNELIDAAEHNEKQKSQLEIEKLLSQINPHFLHNTLNSVQWLARMNGQKEIDKLVTLLVKVLHYNLGKQSLIVTLQEELEALHNYMELQRVRYDYEFDFDVEADKHLLNTAIPRFLLQPLVENAIYHGSSEQTSRVTVSIRTSGTQRMEVNVMDNGSGMTEEEAAQLLEDDNKGARRGLGIGLSYVSRLLKRYYGEEAAIAIRSQPGVGTKVRIELPIRGKEHLE
ncbi:two-component system sensor histidine kinase YesM [Paenibacillus phyllosphaerae]|uniref:histidine kinase n=1 Tax=Paenibacillus phyllosphaerae TaxID=274593 RepID=A0A7W5AZI2_9BACL|nr:histidine kinase [Paenibacillus phyllosphaerae]MBB3111649.1 two-component system sensor histidine kinase YesM [Paenibacillus phyllosphaerae]